MVCDHGGINFSLSLRERAGVRGKRASKITGALFTLNFSLQSR